MRPLCRSSGHTEGEALKIFLQTSKRQEIRNKDLFRWGKHVWYRIDRKWAFDNLRVLLTCATYCLASWYRHVEDKRLCICCTRGPSLCSSVYDSTVQLVLVLNTGLITLLCDVQLYFLWEELTMPAVATMTLVWYFEASLQNYPFASSSWIAYTT